MKLKELKEHRKSLRAKTADELQSELLRLRREEFTFRMQKASGRLGQTHLVTSNRLAIARVKTIMTEQKRNG